MRTSHALRAVLVRLRAVGLNGEAALIEAEADRVRAIENAIEAVLDSFDDPIMGDEPITFPARSVPGTAVFKRRRAQAAD